MNPITNRSEFVVQPKESGVPNALIRPLLQQIKENIKEQDKMAEELRTSVETLKELKNRILTEAASIDKLLSHADKLLAYTNK